MNKFKIVNWIKYVYTAYDLDVAQKEVFMFVRITQMMITKLVIIFHGINLEKKVKQRKQK